MGLKKLIVKSFFLLLPFMVITGYFFIEDPMKIVHANENPVSPGVLMNDRVFQARYLESTDIEYNSFIFGSSRSRAFKSASWVNYLKDENAVPFHMGVNDETLYGLERKIHYLDSLGFPVKNILFVVDHRLLSLTKNHDAHIFREYYSLTNETATSFYQRFFKAFLNVEFLKNYLNYKRTGDVGESGNFLWDPGFRYNKQTGDIYYERMDKAIAKDSVQFYKESKKTFHTQSPKESEELMTSEAKALIDKIIGTIQKIEKRNPVSVKVIITPNYDQVAINPNDLNYLREQFGKNNVYNFSGKNNITDEIGNFYEHKHFKPYIANHVMHWTYNTGILRKN